jgi:hypothetical protein
VRAAPLVAGWDPPEDPAPRSHLFPAAFDHTDGSMN